MGLPKRELFHEYIDYWAEVDSNFPSIKYSGKGILTAGELKELSLKAATGFYEMGVRKGDTIVTVLTTIPEFIITWIAASRIGAIVVPMDVNYKRTDFLNMIPHSQPKVVVSLKKFHKNKIASTLFEIKEHLGNVIYIVKGDHKLGISWSEFIEKDYSSEKIFPLQGHIDENDTILIVWTGGSTGSPKAVCLSHKNVVSMILHEVRKVCDFLGKKPGADRFVWLANLPVSHVGGSVEMLGTGLIGGLKLRLQKEWSPWPALQVMQNEKTLFAGGVPTMFSIWTALPDLLEYNLKSTLKVAFMSGDKVSLHLLNKISEKMCETIIVGYGSTEAGAEVSFSEPGDSYEDLANGYVGKPLPGVDIIVVDENGSVLPPNQDGEILVKGDITSQNYFNMPEETKRGFSEDGYCKTGDLGHLDGNGGLWITGRIKFIIRVGSYTVLPSEIEDIVNKQKNVLVSAAFGVPDEKYGEVVWLVIGPEPGTTVNETEIMERLTEELANYKLPRKILNYEVDAANMPFTSIGKVDRPRIQQELNIPKK
ncbi:MAG: acyl--CoA ligase [Candidatus Lokiarchaeota archaeon]|nr:acyl--CoA ligase [Candidatus Lokiarchaeota archaeon]